jgi:menaquinone-dependent protoporphyrinogen oxidase
MKAHVVYGSKRGGTAGLAEMIGAEFRRHGWDAEVSDATVAGPVADADVVVVGGALYLNRWHRAARRFVRRNADALGARQVWLFSSGPLDESARPGDTAPVPQVQALAQRVEARGHMTFGGRLEKDAKGFIARSMAKTSAGDFRDPEHVREWVDLIVRETVMPGTLVLPRQRSAETQPAPTTSGFAPLS